LNGDQKENKGGMKAPTAQIFMADFFMDTLEWSVDEVGMYWRLLEAQWVNGDLPDNQVRLARIAGCGAKKFQKGWTTIQFKFVLNGNGRLQNIRLEETREAQRKYRESQKEKSKKGVEARQKHTTHGSTHGSSNGSTPGQPLQSSSSFKEEEKDIQQAVTPALLFPLRDGTEYPLELAKITEYEKTYHNIDVQFELKKCVQWNIDNPGKQKTKTGILKHINHWLSEASKSKGPPVHKGIEHDNTAVEEARKELEKITPEQFAKNRAKIAELARGVIKGM